MGSTKVVRKQRKIVTNNLSLDQNRPGFVKYDADKKETVLAVNSALDNYQLIGRTSASRETYQNIDTSTSVRDQFQRGDYEYFRSSESIPRRPEDIILMCMQAYRRVGLIRNIIDLMSDFGAEGVRLVHPNPRIQKFYRGWFRKVGGVERTERFLNVLYRCGNVIVNRSMAKIDLKDERRMRALGVDEIVGPDIEPDLSVQPLSRTIPYRYVFLNPLSLEILGKDVAQFVGKQAYAIKINNNIRRAATTPKNEYERRLIAALPVDLRNAILRGDREFPLDPSKVSAYHYKKDDWQNWADPLIFAVLDDLILLEKMKLADLAALDGAISQVRLWKLGDLEKEIFPTDVAVNKLAEILLSNTGGGAFDLIWGPELTLEETSTEVHMFLGGAKYEPVWNSIYAGLGVPPTLTGASTASGFTNNYISLKTLIQRLEYGRSIVRSFWEQEIELVRRAMGFQRSARVEFDRMTLSDEAAEKALYISLVERDIISIDTLLERFGEIPEIEMLKRRREDKLREQGLMAEKAGPYHTAEKMHERVVAALSRGYMTPEQAEIEIPVEFQGQKPPFDKQLEAQIKAKAMSGGPSTPKKKSGGTGGRPKNSKDSSQRKRTAKPVGASEESVDFLTHLVWAKEAQAKITDLVTPAILDFYGKKNLRSLSSDEAEHAEKTKFSILCSIKPFSEITPELIAPILKAGALKNKVAANIYQQYKNYIVHRSGREPTMDELRLIQAATFATIYTMASMKARSVVQGFGDTETWALMAAKRAIRVGNQTSFNILNVYYTKVADGWICTLTYEYEVKLT